MSIVDDSNELRAPVLWPLVVIAAGTAFIVSIPVLMAYSALAAVVAALGAGIVGAPALFAARRLGLRGFLATTGLGLIASAGATWIVRAMSGALTNPLNGYVVLAGIIGAATGAIYATVFDSEGLSGLRVRYQTIGILAGAVVTLLVAISLGVH